MTSGACALAALPVPLQDLVREAAAVLPDRAEELRGHETRHRMLGRFLRDAALLEWCGMTVPGIEAGREEAIDHLLTLQSPGGTFRSGDNVDSPPDSAFTVNDLTLAQALQRQPGIDALLSAARPALVHGGVHTPNHRWEISAALARLSALYGWQDCRDRAEQWLAEGVDLQPDGMFSERSANYAAHVSIPSLLAIAGALDRDELRGTADAATIAQARLTTPDGNIETLASRRQDQSAPFDGGAMLPLLHAHAVRTGDPVTARAAARTLHRADADAALTLLALASEDSSVIGTMPSTAPDPTPARPEVVELRDSGLVVVDHGISRTVIHGGTDSADLGRVVSGASSNATLLSHRTATAAISGLRLSRDFFSLGPLRPSTPVRVTAQSGRVRYRLQEKISGEYFHPLPDSHLSSDGSYSLGFNGRFAAAMDFSARPTEEVTLETTTDVEVGAGFLRARFGFVGPPTAHCLLLTLDTDRVSAIDGRLSATSSERGPRHVLLPATEGGGTAVAEITGPDGSGLRLTLHGALGGPAFYAPGEAYTFLSGTDEPEGPALLVPASSEAELALTIERTSRPVDAVTDAAAPSTPAAPAGSRA